MSLRWEERTPDGPAGLRSIEPALSFLEVFDLLGQLRHGPWVWLMPSCRDGILQHLRGHKTEIGGLLLGRAFVPEAECPSAWGALLMVEDFVPSAEFESSAVSLAMGTEIWNKAREATSGSRRSVVGWYHSHPNLGAFFSARDRRTQRAFFGQSFNVGLVVDPVRDQEAWFAGPDSVEITPHAVTEVSTPMRVVEIL